jgi:hypothetical protein
MFVGGVWEADRVASGGASGGVQRFFVSYTGVDVEWAEWVAWTLEAEGHEALVQAWDLGPGSHFVGERCSVRWPVTGGWWLFCRPPI